MTFKMKGKTEKMGLEAKSIALPEKRSLVGTAALILSGVSFAGAADFPATKLGLFFAFATAVLLAFGAKESCKLKRDFFLAGIVFHLLAFYWLTETITYFGGFSFGIAVLLFSLFALVSSLQFVFCATLYSKFSSTWMERYLLSLPLAWLVSESLIPRMFPWTLSHPLVPWRQISGLAEYVGVYPLSALLVWWGAAAVALVRVLAGQKLSLKPIALVGLATVAVVILGELRLASVETELKDAPIAKIAMIQGNLDAKQKGDLRYFDVNLSRYAELSEKAVEQGAQLIVWPESVLNAWNPTGLNNLRGTKLDPLPDAKVPLLYGTLSYQERDISELQKLLAEHPDLARGEFYQQYRFLRYNSAIGIDASGQVTGRYHKRVLMPFGEYLPLAERFPILRSFSPNTGDLAPGKLAAPIPFILKSADGKSQEVRAAVSICYEDLVTGPSREGVALGANVLVNLTNDAWYGQSKAPYQHHLLALWRAIETRRFMLRATNTGFTGIVDPTGKTIAGLPLFTADNLIGDVSLLEGTTLYVRVGNLPVCLVVIPLFLYWLFSTFRLKTSAVTSKC